LSLFRDFFLAEETDRTQRDMPSGPLLRVDNLNDSHVILTRLGEALTLKSLFPY